MEKQPQGAGKRNAFGNWFIIFLLFFTIKPFFQKETETNKNQGVSINDAINQVFNAVEIPAGSSQKYFSLGVSESQTPTPEILETPVFQVTSTPIIVYQTVQVDRYVPIMPENELTVFRYSYYYPPLGGVNCRIFENGYCVSAMASGDRWEDYIGRAVACDSSYPLGTKFLVVAPEEIKGEYICLDRGGGIEGTDLLDFLSDVQKLPWLEKVYVYVLK